MDHASIETFLAQSRASLAKGPVAMIFAEDDAALGETIAHHRRAGFRALLVFAGADTLVPEVDGLPEVQIIRYDVHGDEAVPRAVNRLIAAAPETTWFYYCYNAEFLFYPFCESRTVGEMIAFHAEERRDAMLSYVVDLYAGDLGSHPDAVALDEALLDRAGYYSLARYSPAGEICERQLDFFGGLRWRFEEHVPYTRRRIDRIALFRAQKGLRLLPDHRFNIEEYNTYACPWHHNLTSAIASFRTAKALKRNPGSSFNIATFAWHNSARFDWSSQQLMELGLMEPGQWF